MRRSRKIIAAIAIAVGLAVALPGSASHPPLVVGTFAAWAPAAFAVSPGETVSFAAVDLTHSFVTDAPLCVGPLGAVACEIIIGVIDDDVPPSASATARIHSSSARGVYQFRCGFHSWMQGAVVVI